MKPIRLAIAIALVALIVVLAGLAARPHMTVELLAAPTLPTPPAVTAAAPEVTATPDARHAGLLVREADVFQFASRQSSGDAAPGHA